MELKSATEKQRFDEFAAAALLGLLAARCPDALMSVDKAASFAYDYAEALVLERRKRVNA